MRWRATAAATYALLALTAAARIPYTTGWTRPTLFLTAILFACAARAALSTLGGTT